MRVMNRPLQVYLDAEDRKRLEAWSRERGWTKSRALRVAIRALTRTPGQDPLLDLNGDLDGLPADLSANVDRYLNETVGAEPPVPKPPRRRARKAVRR